MPKSRQSQVCLADTPYYHCVSRCVRRSFLCGYDEYSGKSYEHRRKWVEERLLDLAQVFAIDICAYAIMSNHTHIVLHVNPDKAKSWSQQHVIKQWHIIHKGTLLTQKWCDPELRKSMGQAELQAVANTADAWRKRLFSISWFMASLNEPIAKAANKEDNCTGRFWEGRFKSQALLDEAALAACMAYVDLNPVRAKLAKTPKQSKHTSIKLRIEKANENSQPHCLLPFIGNIRDDMPVGLPFELKEYIALVKATGKVERHDKRGHIEVKQSPMLQDIGLTDEHWLTLACTFEQHFSGPVGKEHLLRRFQQHVGLKRAAGALQCKQLFDSA